MKVAVIDVVPGLPGIVSVLVYETKLGHFLSMCYNTINWFHKTWQVYDPKTEVLHDAHFFRLNVNDLYNHNIKSVDLIDQLWNMYQVDQWISKYK